MEVTIKQLVREEDQEWETIYVAVPKYGRQDMVPITIMETVLQDAIDQAKKYVIKYPDTPLHINMAKRFKGDVLCAVIE
jgi:hypothetical protein